MSKKPRFSKSQFFRELVKTTEADLFTANLVKYNWERKYEYIKQNGGDFNYTLMLHEAAETKQDLAKLQTFTDFLSYAITWAFAIHNYNRVTEINDVYATSLQQFESWLIDLAENKVLQTKQQPSALAVALFNMSRWHYLWSLYNRPSFVLSPDLSTMLQYTKLDGLPTDGLRLPYPILVLAPPGEDMIRLFNRAGCIFVIEEENGDWHIGIQENNYKYSPLGIFKISRPGTTLNQVVETWELQEKEDENHRQIVRRFGWEINEPEDKQTVTIALNYVAACVIYATLPDADKLLASDSPLYAQWIASLQNQRFTKRERKEHKLFENRFNERRFYLGRTIKIINRHLIKEKDDEKTGTHASPRLHWRSGHYKRVWHGSGEDRHTEIHWIKPTLVGLPQPGITIESRAGMR